MEVIKVNGKLTAEEREVTLNFDPINKTWTMDSTVPKIFRKALKQGWTPIKQYVYEDGSAVGGVFEGSDKAITIRNPNIKRVMSELQMKNLRGHDEDDDEDED